MAGIIQPPPTWASPILEDEKTGESQFNPVWIKWFIDLVGVINVAGGGAITHNSTSSLQGGQSNEYYHLTALEHLATRLFGRQGTSAAAANNLDLLNDGDYYQITGATQINLLSNTDWQGGSMVTLKFNSTPTVKHNQAISGVYAPIMLAGGVDFVTTASDTLTLRYDALDSKWYEVSRAVI